MSPFELFRRNLKPFMIVATLLSIFAFVVLPTVEQYMRTSGGGGYVDAQVASFDGVPLKQSRIDYFTRNHQTTVRFLRELGDETIRRGGSPKTPGFVYDTQNKRIQQVGIDENPSPLTTVRTLQFASEAEKAGFELDDTAIDSWLQQYTDGMLSDSEISQMLARSSRNSMGIFHLREQLRSQLNAQLYQRGAFAGILTSRQMPMITPAQQWTNFLKLNRQATVDTYGVLVQDFYDQTNAEPTASDIQATYDQGKDRYPNSQSPNPAFKRREKATFEYVMADMQAMVDEEVAKLSEEEIRAEYEKQVKGGAFLLPSNAAADMLKAAEEAEAEAAEARDAAAEAKEDGDASSDEAAEEDGAAMKKGDAEGDATEDKKQADPKPAAATGTDEKKESEEKKAAESKAGAEKKAAVIAPAEMKKADVSEPGVVAAKDSKPNETAKPKPAAAKPKKKKKEIVPPSAEKAKANKDQVDRFKQELDAAAKEAFEETAEKAGSGDQSRVNRSNNGVRLVLFQEDEKKDDGTQESDAAADTTSEAKAEPATEVKAADGEPVEGDATADAEDADEPGETKSDEANVQSFEEVRKRVAEGMVQRVAAARMDDAVQKVTSTMRLYFNKRAIHESNVSIGQEEEAPVRPDIKKMATDLGLNYAKIGPHDIVSLKDEPIAQSQEMGASLSQRGPPFTTMMYGQRSQQGEIPKQQLFAPLGTVDTQAMRSYVSWKVEETEAYVPELEECREEVIKAIRMDEARDLARAAADALVDKVAKGETLEDLIPEDKKFSFKTGLGPFSWMNSFGFGGAFLGNVPELDSVGEEFMGKAFSTKPGELGVAANLPERVIYIIRPTDFQPTLDDLKEQFKQPMGRNMAMLLGTEDAGSVYQGFYEAMDERTGFNYQDPSEDE